MRAATWPGGDDGGKHQLVVLARFRPTWRQALARGLWGGMVGTIILAGVALAAPPLLSVVTGGAWQMRAPPDPGWLAVLAPLPLGLAHGVVLRCRVGTRLDDLGVRSVPFGLDSFVPWRLVADIRAERRHGRTVVVVYLDDGTRLRLHAPYDSVFSPDPRFERKLFLICHVWQARRNLRAAR